jgi:hypothetical protein
MMFDHSIHKPMPVAHNKELASFLRNFKSFNNIRNPFYGAEAIFGDLGILISGGEYDKGLIFVLAGDNMGDVYKYTDIMAGVSTDLSFSGEIGRFDLIGLAPEAFLVKQLSGKYRKYFAGLSFIGGLPFGVSGAYTKSYPYADYKTIYIRSWAIQFSLGYSVLGIFSGGIQWGSLEF